MPAPLLPGYARLPGASRRYRPPKGVRLPAGVKRSADGTISDRAYRKIVAAKGLKTSQPAQRHARQVRAQKQYNRLLSQAAAQARAEGKPASKAAIRKSPEFKNLIRDLKARHPKNKPRLATVEARKRRALEALGYRQGIPEWVPVGLSDRYRAGKLRRDRIPKKWRVV